MFLGEKGVLYDLFKYVVFDLRVACFIKTGFAKSKACKKQYE